MPYSKDEPVLARGDAILARRRAASPAISNLATSRAACRKLGISGGTGLTALNGNGSPNFPEKRARGRGVL